MTQTYDHTSTHSIISIIHQNDQWLVIDKPAGLSVHNAEDPMNVLSVLERQRGHKLFPVHRLDKPTSGILLLACHSEVVAPLQIALRRATKMYVALVRGVPDPTEGIWAQSISDRSEGRKNPRGAHRVHAETHYCVTDSNRHLARIECVIKTGRQHQIRKHCVINRHEIIGDSRYGDRRYQQKLSQRFGTLPLCLQARSLHIMIDQQTFMFEAPPRDDWERLTSF